MKNVEALQNDFEHDQRLLYWLLFFMSEIYKATNSYEALAKEVKDLRTTVEKLQDEVNVYKRIDKLEQRLLER